MTYPNDTELGIFIIEDDRTFVEYLTQTLKNSFQDASIYSSLDFDEGLSLLKQKRPDILILDLYRGDIPERDLAGSAIWDYIWKDLFVPIIIYTAGIPDLEPRIPKDHPFISYISKGKGSEKKVIEKITSYQPCISALRAVLTEIDKTTQVVLRDLSPLIWGLEADESTKQEVLKRSARRRLGAWMDLSTVLGGEPLLDWEQYIIPPLGDNLLMGDIIKTRNREKDKWDPTAYRLVLSPSCDLIKRGDSAKMEQVLVASCYNITKYIKACGFDPNAKPKDLKKTLSSLKEKLTHPQIGGIIALPGLPSISPSMAACLRDLELIPLNKTACSDREKKDNGNFDYERIASVDSPFREQISWGFLLTACRPGLPERDFSYLIEEFKGILSEKKK